MSIPDPLAAAKTVIDVGQFIAKHGPRHTLKRANEDLRAIVPILDDHKDCKPTSELDNLLRQYDKLRSRADELEETVNERVNLTVKMKRVISLVRETHRVKRKTKALITAAKMSSERARRQKLRQYIENAHSPASSINTAAITPKQSKPPESQTEGRMTDGCLSPRIGNPELEPRRRVTLAVRDRTPSPAKYKDSASEACISETSHATRRYPAQVQVTTSVSSLEQLCPGIAHRLFDSLEDEETYSDAEGGLVPLVVWASPLDSPEHDTSCHLFGSAEGDIARGNSLILDEPHIEHDSQGACKSW